MLKQFWKDHKTASVIIIVILLALLGFSIYSAYNQDQNTTSKSQIAKVAPAEQKESKIKQKEESEVSGGQLPYYITFILIAILLITLVIIAIQVYNENTGDWSKISLSPVGMAIIAVLVLNLSAALGIPYYWLKFWNEHMFFFLCCTSVIVATHFYNKKSKAAKSIAYGIMIIVFFSGINTYSISAKGGRFNIFEDLWDQPYAKLTLAPKTWSKPIQNIYSYGRKERLVWHVTEGNDSGCEVRFNGDDKDVHKMSGKYDRSASGNSVVETIEFRCDSPKTVVARVVDSK